VKLADKVASIILEYSFYLLLFIVPLIFTSVNFELFEFNKMLLTYGLTIVIVSAWAVRMIAQNKIIFRKSFWDIPLALFLFSQIISFIFSIDPHTSLFGYYSRFNGGLISIITYCLLYWALVANFNRQKTFRLLNITLVGAILVSIYAILEHFGHSFSCLLITKNFDVSCWVQDVQNRVFATLGQPNWLATYLVGLIPLTWATVIISNLKDQKSNPKLKAKNFLGIIIFITLFTTLLFTKSRSGLIGFTISYGIFWLLIFSSSLKKKIKEVLDSSELTRTIKMFLLFTFCLSLITLVIGSPWTPTLSEISDKLQGKTSNAQAEQVAIQAQQELISPQGGTESGEIRMIVWKGALEIWKHYPVLGTGPETFAYSYYWYRPREHNDISEWDFLYNKAHNEYLNYAATTGTVGLVSYLLLIGSFVVFTIRSSFWGVLDSRIYFKKDKKKILESPIHPEFNRMAPQNDGLELIKFALLSGFIAICVTNFFGFSVVIVNLLLFLLPAIAITLDKNEQEEITIKNNWTNWQIISVTTVIIVGGALLISVINYWRADNLYASALKQVKNSQNAQALESSQQAINLWPYEPVYYDEMSIESADLAEQIYSLSKDKTKIQGLFDLSVYSSNQTIQTSPYNLNFWKNRTKIFYQLANIDGNLLLQAEDALVQANKIAPTDAKITYNLALIQYQLDQTDEAINALQKTIELKPNYTDAHYALALFYEKKNEKEKAKQELQFILDKIDPNFQLAKEKLKSL